MRNGKKTEGTLLGANSRQIDFLTSQGESIRLPIDDVASITFSSSKAMPLRTGQAVVIPAGTLLRIRTIDPIDVDTTQAGMKFRAALDDPILSGGSVIVSRGANVILVAAKVEQGGKFKGSDVIQLKAISIAVNGKPHQVVTSLSETKSGGEGKKTSRKSRRWHRSRSTLSEELRVEAKARRSAQWQALRAERVCPPRANRI